MNDFPEGRAIVYCEGAFGTTNGKTAHGLVRRSERYRVLSIVDSKQAGRDAGDVLDGKSAGIPVLRDLQTALTQARGKRHTATHFVIGVAPDGGRLPDEARDVICEAIRSGLAVDSGLHDFLSEDPRIARLAKKHEVAIRDVRKPPDRKYLHFFSGKIEEVESFRIAMLGTDSAVGKRTTAWILRDALRAAGHTAEMIGTGQTAWMQGAQYGIVLDSLVNDFVSGEIEHVISRCWMEQRPEIMVLEGQGSLMNPAYPGGLELLAAGRPHVVVLQHAPARTHYDGFPRHPLHRLERQIEAIEMLGEKPVVAVAINHEGLSSSQTREACTRIRKTTGLPAVDVLLDGPAELIAAVRPFLEKVRT
jgi:uncharacterized NAD-dependent epimerase/dehydratase family protein